MQVRRLGGEAEAAFAATNGFKIKQRTRQPRHAGSVR
jgi:hypothetical protein